MNSRIGGPARVINLAAGGDNLNGWASSGGAQGGTRYLPMPLAFTGRWFRAGIYARTIAEEAGKLFNWGPIGPRAPNPRTRLSKASYTIIIYCSRTISRGNGRATHFEAFPISPWGILRKHFISLRICMLCTWPLAQLHGHRVLGGKWCPCVASLV